MCDASAPAPEDETKYPELKGVAGTRRLTPEAERALEEAARRRRPAAPSAQPEEIGGRSGWDPARYGDWEVKGIASDF